LAHRTPSSMLARKGDQPMTIVSTRPRAAEDLRRVLVDAIADDPVDDARRPALPHWEQRPRMDRGGLPMKVRDIMTRDVISVGTTTPLREVALILAESRISGVVVVDESRTPVGIVSEGDLLAKQLSRPAKRRDALEWIFGEHGDADELRRRAAVTAAEAMSAPVVTIDADRPLREVAALMVDRDVNRLPVMADGVLAGIVTRADMVRAYLALDDEIASTIREQVLRKTMWLEPTSFDVAVRDGRVEIVGQVDRRSTADIVARLIGVVDGVVSVKADLRWALDDTHLAPAVETEAEPGAASLVAREERMPLHR
jgi:CBS domain-containing protein